MKLHQITEDDLATLEKLLPELCDHLMNGGLDNARKAKIRQVQRIISDVRWNYGPPSDVQVIPAEPA